MDTGFKLEDGSDISEILLQKNAFDNLDPVIVRSNLGLGTLATQDNTAGIKFPNLDGTFGQALVLGDNGQLTFSSVETNEGTFLTPPIITGSFSEILTDGTQYQYTASNSITVDPAANGNISYYWYIQGGTLDTTLGNTVVATFSPADGKAKVIGVYAMDNRGNKSAIETQGIDLKQIYVPGEITFSAPTVLNYQQAHNLEVFIGDDGGDNNFTYAWEVSYNNGLTWNTQGFSAVDLKSVIFSPTKAEVTGKFRCRIRNSAGVTTAVSASFNVVPLAPSAPLITSSGNMFYSGEYNILATVGSNGGTTNLDYEWSVSYDGGSSWETLGIGNPTLPQTTFIPNRGDLTGKLRCKITNISGSVTVTKDVSISAIPPSGIQLLVPPNMEDNGDYVLNANPTSTGGTVVSYDWETSTDGGNTWGTTYLVDPTEKQPTLHNVQNTQSLVIRCRVSNVAGYAMATSGVLTVAIGKPSHIDLNLPESFVVGSPVLINPTINDDGGDPNITYSWFLSYTNGSTWIIDEFSSPDTQATNFTPLSGNVNALIRLSATNSAGTTIVTSAPIPVAAVAPSDLLLVIPDSFDFNTEATLGVNVVHNGGEECTFNWEVQTKTGLVVSEWVQAYLTDFDTNAPKFKKDDIAECQVAFRCTVSNSAGSAVAVSDYIDVHALVPSAGTIYMDAEGHYGTPVPFQVSIPNTGGVLSYNWRISTDNKATWTAIGIVDPTVNPMSYNAPSIGLNVYARCVVSNSAGSRVIVSDTHIPILASLVSGGELVAPSGAWNYGSELSLTANYTSDGGSAPSFKWEKSTDAGATWDDTGFASSISQSTFFTPSVLGNLQFRCTLTNSAGIVVLYSETKNVNPVAPSNVILSLPTEFSRNVSSEIGVTVGSNGGSEVSFEWTLSEDEGVTWSNTYFDSPTSQVLIINYSGAANTITVKCRIYNIAGEVSSSLAVPVVSISEFDDDSEFVDVVAKSLYEGSYDKILGTPTDGLFFMMENTLEANLTSGKVICRCENNLDIGFVYEIREVDTKGKIEELFLNKAIQSETLLKGASFKSGILSNDSFIILPDVGKVQVGNVIETLKQTGNVGIKSLACGISHTVCLLNNGDVVAWGDNTYGQSNPRTVDTSIWNDLSTTIVSNIKEIYCGAYHTVCITEDGELITWGDNTYGQSNPGVIDEIWRGCDTPIAKDVFSACAGFYHTMFIDYATQSLFGFGKNDKGQVNPSNIGSSFRNISAPVSDIYVFSKVFAGKDFTLYLDDANQMGGFGDNAFNQVSVSSTTPFLDVSATLMTDVLKVACGENTVYCISSAGDVYGWGSNSSNQVNSTASPIINTPTVILTHSGTDIYTDIVAGSNFALAYNSNGDVYGWGSNSFKQISPSNVNNIISVAEIIGNWVGVKLFAGKEFSFHLNDDSPDYLTGSGKNDFGQVKTGDNSITTWIDNAASLATEFNLNYYEYAMSLFTPSLTVVPTRCHTIRPDLGNDVYIPDLSSRKIIDFVPAKKSIDFDTISQEVGQDPFKEVQVKVTYEEKNIPATFAEAYNGTSFKIKVTWNNYEPFVFFSVPGETALLINRKSLIVKTPTERNTHTILGIERNSFDGIEEATLTLSGAPSVDIEEVYAVSILPIEFSADLFDLAGAHEFISPSSSDFNEVGSLRTMNYTIADAAGKSSFAFKIDSFNSDFKERNLTRVEIKFKTNVTTP